MVWIYSIVSFQIEIWLRDHCMHLYWYMEIAKKNVYFSVTRRALWYIGGHLFGSLCSNETDYSYSNIRRKNLWKRNESNLIYKLSVYSPSLHIVVYSTTISPYMFIYADYKEIRCNHTKLAHNNPKNGPPRYSINWSVEHKAWPISETILSRIYVTFLRFSRHVRDVISERPRPSPGGRGLSAGQRGAGGRGSLELMKFSRPRFPQVVTWTEFAAHIVHVLSDIGWWNVLISASRGG